MKKLLLSVSLVALLAVSCGKKDDVGIITPLPPPQTSPTPTPTPTPEPTTQNGIYENDYMKITIPAGWTAKQAVKILYVGNCTSKETCAQTKTTQPNPAAVNITKGNYILYINTEASQASGVEGGRFAEIAMGAPSADAVVTEQPSPPCMPAETSAAYGDFKRADLYVNNKNKPDYCVAPTDNTTAWYFSYLTKTGGYFNYYNGDSNPALVVTMAYNSKDVNHFPGKDTPGLVAALNDMTNIAKTLQLKKH